MDIQTGELEAKILEEDVTTSNAKEKTHLDIDPNTQGQTDALTMTRKLI